MAQLSAVLTVQDINGVRVDAAMKTKAGDYPPVMLRCGTNIDASAARNGPYTEITLSIAAAANLQLGAVTATSLSIGSATPPQYAVTVGAAVSSTDSTTKTLATIPVPAGESIDVEMVVSAVLGPGQVNGNLAPTIYRLQTTAYRIGTGAAASLGAVDSSDVSPPFIAPEASPTIGTISVTASGNNILVQAKGFAAPSAWVTATAYVRGDNNTIPGDFVTANGNVYVCTTSGTSSGSAPSGTGRDLGTGAKFDYVAAGSAVPINWTLTKQETRTG